MDAAPTNVSPRFERLRKLIAGRRGVGLASGLLIVVGLGLFLLETPVWWFGGAVLAAGCTLVAGSFGAELAAWAEGLRKPRVVLGRELRPLTLLTDVIYVAVIVWIGTVMMWEITGGERPVSHDHTIHYAKAWLLHEHLLPSFRLFGWSHSWFAGYPANYLYPPGADLWVNAVHAVFFGALDFSRSYAVAFWIFHVFSGLALYRFGRLVGGPHVGLLAGLLSLTDLSTFRMGGWAYTVEYGVWPQALSLSFLLMALCSLPAIVQERRLAPLGAFGFWTGLAILTHPIQLIFLALLLLGTMLAAAFTPGIRSATALLRMLVGYALSLLVASAWLIPFLDTRGETNQMGIWWDSTYEMAKGLLDLRALPGTLGYVLAYGVLAIVVMLRSRSFVLLLVALMSLIVPAVSNSTFIDELHLPQISPAFAKVQFVRLSTMVKPFWFVLSAYLVVAVFAHARALVLGVHPRSHERGSTPRAVVLAFVVALLTLPVLLPTAQAFWSRHVRKSMTTESDRPLLADRLKLEAWLRKHLPKGGFYRVGVFTGHNHDLMDLGPILNRPIFKRGFTPASNFIYQMKERDPAVLEAVNVRYAISKVVLPPDQFELAADLGAYRVYRFRRYRADPFEVVTGEGKVRLERFSDEEIVLRAAPGAHGKLRLNVSYFSRWRAYRDGVKVPFTITYLPQSPDDTGFITVPLAPGRYRFAFERTLGDHLAVPFGLLGLLACLSFVLADRGRPGLRFLPAWLDRASALSDRFSEPGLERARTALTSLAALSVLGTGIALALWRPAIDLTELRFTRIQRVRYDFLERLPRASANIEYREGNQPCLRQGDRLVCRDELGNLDNERYVASSPATIKEYTMVRCIRARPEPNALLSIAYPKVPLGDAIVGYFGIERAGRLLFRRRPVEFTIMLDGALIYEARTQSDNKMHYFNVKLPGGSQRRGTVVFSVRAENVSKRYFCFQSQVVDLK